MDYEFYHGQLEEGGLDIVAIILIADAVHVKPFDPMNISDGCRARSIDELRDATVSILRGIFRFLMDLKGRTYRSSVGA